MSNKTIGAAAEGTSHDAIVKRLAALEERVRELAAVRTLAAASIDAGGLDVQGGGSITITGGGGLTIGDGGDVVLDGGDVKSANFAHGSAGYRLQGDGTAEFNSLVLRAGIIGDDALENPVKAIYHENIGAADLSGDPGPTVTFTTPAGFTQALIFATATTVVTADSSGLSLLVVGVGINGDGGTGLDVTYEEWDTSTMGSKFMPIASNFARTARLAGLSDGDTFTVENVSGDLGTGVTGGAGTAKISALALFLR